MNKSDFIIKEIVDIPIIKRYALLSKTEYSKDNPRSLEEHLKWKDLNNPKGLSYGINGYSR